jgi:uncharacterized phiE125 gp8 family phage protein
MNLRLYSAPAAEPVSVATAKTFLRVDGSDDDALITSLIKAAREKGEELSRRAFITQTWEQTEDYWPVNSFLTGLRSPWQLLSYGYVLQVYRPPLQSVTSVKYTDPNGVEATWTDYRVDTKSEPGKIIFTTLPGVSLQKTGAITVRFVAGYGTAGTNVPERINDSILSLVAYWYENRESHDVPANIKSAFIDERVVWF